jgi:hypothetical protein
MDERKEKKLHDIVALLGIRAHANMAGFVQLTRELARAGVLDPQAVERIKDAIVKDLSLDRPPNATKESFEDFAHRRLDAVFAGEESVGDLPPSELNKLQTPG